MRIPFKMQSLITSGKDLLNISERSDVVYKLNCIKCYVVTLESSTFISKD